MYNQMLVLNSSICSMIPRNANGNHIPCETNKSRWTTTEKGGHGDKTIEHISEARFSSVCIPSTTVQLDRWFSAR